MANISLEQARLKFTQKLVSMYSDSAIPTAFLRSFFRTETSDTKYISIGVERDTELIAVDVQRGTQGNRNEFTQSSEAIYLPPYFSEYFDATELDFYDLLFGDSNGSVNGKTFASWVKKVIKKLQKLQFKIERAQELQCAQVIEDGIVTMENGDNIDFKRKTASKVVITTKWDNAASTPIADLQLGCEFIRKNGLYSGGDYNLICGGDSLEALIQHADIKERADLRDYELAMIHAPQRNSTGATLHGRITVGSYKVNLWAYAQFYKDADGNIQPYLNEKKCTLLPAAPVEFVMAYAAVPMLIRDTKNAEFGGLVNKKEGKFLITNYLDMAAKAHVFEIASASVPVPVAVDMIYTMQVLA